MQWIEEVAEVGDDHGCLLWDAICRAVEEWEMASQRPPQ